MNFIFVYVTNPDKKVAESISSHLLKKKLIACSNMFPIDSSYWWKNKIEKSKEYVLIMKTKKENWEKVKTEVKKIHPYSIPCIIKIEVEANSEYEKWLEQVIE